MKRLVTVSVRQQGLMIGMTLIAGALFKLSAFVREAFITSHFGLTPVTDTYFTLQQMPITLATFMFGAFSRAFTPAYTESLTETGRAEWLAGLLLYAVLAVLLLTAVTLISANSILALFRISADPANAQSLVILIASYLPIVLTGFCSAIWMSYGRSLGSLTLTGIPYLLMTVSLVGIYFAGLLGDLSLPISMTLGFVVAGAYGSVVMLMKEKPFHNVGNLFAPWGYARCRRFFQQLAMSSIETLGYSASQFTMLYFVARAGTGAISANNCATRIGMLGFSLIALPLTQVMQARMCVQEGGERHRMVRTYLIGMAFCTLMFAGGLHLFRYNVAQFIYLRGNFSHGALDQVVDMLPAWLGYFVIMSMNAVTARYLFTVSQGGRYTRHMLGGYALTNCLRWITAGHMPAPWIVWCAVIGEGCALALNLQACLIRRRYRVPLILMPGHQEVPG